LTGISKHRTRSPMFSSSSGVFIAMNGNGTAKAGGPKSHHPSTVESHLGVVGGVRVSERAGRWCVGQLVEPPLDILGTKLASEEVG
jgi:hypothetical protein